MPGPVLAYRPPLEAVPLVGSPEVHPADQRGLVARVAHGVGPGGYARAEDVLVCPDTVGRGTTGGHERHATRNAYGRGAVGVLEQHPFGRQPVQVGGPNEAVAVAAQLPFAVLVGHQHEDVVLASWHRRTSVSSAAFRLRKGRTGRDPVSIMDASQKAIHRHLIRLE